ncbi:MAG TPA: transglutaminase family protein [Burkholderiales bacterium]|jgi:transglutaminase-like putative cysteine protease|nr:transglutaminase family protein [Burkholderiales bacterium]
MRLEIRHETIYRYSTPANYSIQYVRQTPRTEGGQRILSWYIDTPGRRWRQTDAYGNSVLVLSLTEPHTEIRVIAQGQVETTDERGMVLPHDSAVPPLAFALPTPLTQADAAIHTLAEDSIPGSGAQAGSREQLEALMHAVSKRMAYVLGTTDVHATAAEALAQGSGVCQDLAHVFLAACRSRGVPARYISGYLLDDSSHVASSHAWAEAWIADANRGAGGWLGFDVTQDRLAGPELCRLAVGRDYLDASPIRGMRLGGAEEEMKVNVTVARPQYGQ